MIEDLILIISPIIAIIALGISYYLYVTTKRNLMYQVIVELQMEYRKPEMQYALWILWGLYDEVNEDEEALMKKYGEKYYEEKKILQKVQENYYKKTKMHGKPQEKPIETLKTTLDHQRRLVSQYYHHLAVLTVNNIVPKNTIYKIWDEEALKIIPEILIPMHQKLLEIHHKEPKDKEYSDMRQLYIDSKDYK
ncbi:MAG: hypothetical protein JW878_10220 [Methanomicrobia archaeon]|nr:hypothetical protein [Methanomicrobia archaeon]